MVARVGARTTGDTVDASAQLYQAQTEIRQLKGTVAALRAQIEEMSAARDAAVQSAVAASRDEVRQLQGTVQTLRDELQGILLAKDAAVQAATVSAQDEARQLQATIAALRQELESAHGR